MAALPRVCAGLLLLSLLCTTTLCQRTKSECSLSMSALDLCLVLPSRTMHVPTSRAACLSSCPPSPQHLGLLSCKPRCCFLAISAKQPNRASAGSPRDGGSPSTAHPFFFLHSPPPPDNPCVQSRARSCSECIRVDKECSFCTEEVRPGRGHWGSASRLVSGPASHHPWGKIQERNLRAEPAPGSSFSRPKARDMDFPWLRHWQAGRRESLGQTSRIQGFSRKCLLARPETLHGEECPRDGGRVLSQTAQ